MEFAVDVYLVVFYDAQDLEHQICYEVFEFFVVAFCMRGEILREFQNQGIVLLDSKARKYLKNMNNTSFYRKYLLLSFYMTLRMELVNLKCILKRVLQQVHIDNLIWEVFILIKIGYIRLLLILESVLIALINFCK